MWIFPALLLHFGYKSCWRLAGTITYFWYFRCFTRKLSENCFQEIWRLLQKFAFSHTSPLEHLQEISAPQCTCKSYLRFLPWSHPANMTGNLLCLVCENKNKCFSMILLSSLSDIDYSFNLDDSEGMCDLFDGQILNYWWLTTTQLNAYTKLRSTSCISLQWPYTDYTPPFYFLHKCWATTLTITHL